MKKYVYEKVLNENIIGCGYYSHRKIIDMYAKKVYKYVGFIPTEMLYGAFTKIDLIFEIDVEDGKCNE